jgi:murein DD-endopeptidase MepM/ murein hydrolase activator NlpD
MRRIAVVAIVLICGALVGPAAHASGRHHRYHYRFPVAHCRVSYERYHHDYPATDIFAAKGCPFVAPIAGTVDEVSRHDRWNPRRDLGATRGGLSVSIIGIDGVRYYGSHLSRIAKGIRPGTHVREGRLLGRVGKTGDARDIGYHLHFGISWPTRHHIWWVRRGEVWPYRFITAWRHGHRHVSPVHAVTAALRRAGRRVPRCSADC